MAELADLVDKKRLTIYSITSYVKRVADAAARIEHIRDNLSDLREQKKNLKRAKIISMIEYDNIRTLIVVTREELENAVSDLDDKRRILKSERLTLEDVEIRIQTITHRAAQYGRVLQFTRES